MEQEEFEALLKLAQNKPIYKNAPEEDPLVPVVGPNGEFQEVRCGPRDSKYITGSRLVLYSYELQETHIPKKFKDMGWIKYEDLCRQTDSMHYYRNWERVKKALEEGGRVQGIDFATFYHPEVIRRRQNSKDGRKLIQASDLKFEEGSEKAEDLEDPEIELEDEYDA